MRRWLGPKSCGRRSRRRPLATMSAVAETFLRRVLGDVQWESFPDPLRQMFVENSPAILAEFRGPWFEATAEDLARIGVPTLLVAGDGSPPAFRRVTERMAAADPELGVAPRGGRALHRPGRAGRPEACWRS